MAHGSSTTLRQIGLVDALKSSPKYAYGNAEWLAEPDAVRRNSLRRRISVDADVYLGSVQAITRGGQVLGADFSGSRQAFYLFGPAKVIWVAGVNKIVNSLGAAFERIQKVALPKEDARMKDTGGFGSAVNKIAVYEAEPIENRITLVLVNDELGF